MFQRADVDRPPLIGLGPSSSGRSVEYPATARQVEAAGVIREHWPTSGCFERLWLTLAEYERIRQDGTHFLIADGHEDIEIEQVIAHHTEYVVVEKDGVAGLVAEDDNPRA